jgi:hypothetical protein
MAHAPASFRRLKKSLAESMLDVATEGSAGKVLTPRDSEALRDLGDPREVLLAAARLRSDQAWSEDFPLCVAACGRHRRAGAAEGTGALLLCSYAIAANGGWSMDMMKDYVAKLRQASSISPMFPPHMSARLVDRFHT